LSVFDDPTIFPICLSLIAIWYALSSLWHFADKGLRPVRLYSDLLVKKSLVYFSILIIFIFITYYLGTHVITVEDGKVGTKVFTVNGREVTERLTVIQGLIATLGVMGSVVVLMIVFNIDRLN